MNHFDLNIQTIKMYMAGLPKFIWCDHHYTIIPATWTTCSKQSSKPSPQQTPAWQESDCVRSKSVMISTTCAGLMQTCSSQPEEWREKQANSADSHSVIVIHSIDKGSLQAFTTAIAGIQEPLTKMSEGLNACINSIQRITIKCCKSCSPMPHQHRCDDTPHTTSSQETTQTARQNIMTTVVKNNYDPETVSLNMLHVHTIVI